MTELDAEVLPAELIKAESASSAKKPGLLRSMWEGWKKIAKKIGEVQSRIILVIFYFVLLLPFALGVRWGSDPLAIKRKSKRGWHPREEAEGTPIEKATRQF